MSTVILQFHKNLSTDKEYIFFIEKSLATVKNYAKVHGYDYILKNEFHESHKIIESENYECMHGWLYWLKDISKKYDHIIKFDSDIYVINDEQPFPISHPGYVTRNYNYADESSEDVWTLNGIKLEDYSKKIYAKNDWRRNYSIFCNPGVAKFDSETALKLYEWVLENRKIGNESIVDINGIKFLGDEGTLVRFIIDNPEIWNPILDSRWNFTWNSNKKNPYFLHPILCKESGEEKSKLRLLEKLINRVL